MAESNQIKLLAIVGPTASGKSALAIALAKQLGGEIVSCDSMQIYCRMDIGTAKPTVEEMNGVPHHLMDLIEPDHPFSCADYVQAAKKTIEEITARGALPILCGGTGLYLDSLLRGGGFTEADTDLALRQELLHYAETYGNHALHERLSVIDPDSAAVIHENNVKRVVRAIEIYETTGITKTEADRRSRELSPLYHPAVIGLRYPHRDLLYQRIDRRVDAMLDAGLMEETQRLLAAGVFASNQTAAQAIGYKELLAYLRGEESLTEATEHLKIATRHYAKRQMTWFGAKDYVQWIDCTDGDHLRSFASILQEALDLFHGKPR